MKQIVLTLSMLFLILPAAAVARAQSLADIAKKEKQRREEISETPDTITNDEISEFSGGAVSTVTPIALPSEENEVSDGSEGSESTSTDGSETESDEPTDLQGRTESYWRDTMSAARSKIKTLEDQSLALTLKMNDLENKFYNIDDGFDRDSVQKEIQKTFYEIDLNKENLAKAKDELDELEKDARSSGALPGWIE